MSDKMTLEKARHIAWELHESPLTVEAGTAQIMELVAASQAESEAEISRLQSAETEGLKQHLEENRELGERCFKLSGELAALRAEVRGWLCAKCGRVSVGLPQPGVQCVICPECGGDTGPRVSMELRAERERAGKLVQGLERIALPNGCGCRPKCHCSELEVLKIWKEESQAIAKEYLAAYRQPDSKGEGA